MRHRAPCAIGKVPFNLGTQIRDEAANLLRNPRAYAYQGACGGTAPAQLPALVQETWIGHYEE